MYFIELFGHLASYFDWYLSDYYLWQFFGINMIPKDCFIGFKMGQYCYFQTKISWNKVYLKLRNWFVFLLCSLHLTSVWCIFWMSYPMMSMDWLIENSAHRTTIRRDKSPTLPISNMINKAAGDETLESSRNRKSQGQSLSKHESRPRSQNRTPSHPSVRGSDLREVRELVPKYDNTF